ncbi:hypothetical protein L249_8755 [Ophiocordyceps polyrhachis-furcata BCC 54312]|uniref:Uncharacterized protein n=1 Tax=Ophiocordyceps polyrhachis-furcata BCC 54312 TaxID=1330021 RepID=A0A367L6C4_9HYPO|nr:hypothetical protein L249_8755 [Ophiocordyceps polyrhachis-furcata BCC 54312]
MPCLTCSKEAGPALRDPPRPSGQTRKRRRRK